MRSRNIASLVAVLAAGAFSFPALASAQDDAAAQTRYEVASEWIEQVMVERDYAGAAGQAHAAVAAQLTPAMLEGAMAQLSPQLGLLNGLEPKGQSMEQGFHQVLLSGSFAAGTFDVLVVLGDDSKVAGFFVRPPS